MVMGYFIIAQKLRHVQKIKWYTFMKPLIAEAYYQELSWEKKDGGGGIYLSKVLYAL